MRVLEIKFVLALFNLLKNSVTINTIYNTCKKYHV